MPRRSSDSEPDASPASSRRGMRRRKRVKFTDSEDNINNNPLSFRFDASSVPVGATKSTRRSEDAKTSEFAFFKKLKENAGEKVTSRSAHNEQMKKSNNFRLRNASEDSVIKKAALISEKASVVLNGSKNIQSALLVENATPVGDVSFNSQHGVGGTETPKNSGIRDENAEIFSIKRQKLHQWVREISFPEADGLNLKGHDIVFKLLSRLVPESKENNDLKDQKFDQVKTDAESMLASHSNANRLCKKLQQINTRASMEHDFGPYLIDDIPYHQSNRLRGRILSVDAPYSHDNNIRNHWHRVWESDSELNGENQLLRTSSYANFSFPPTRFRYVEPVDELVTISQPKRYSVGSSLNIPMLGWEFNDKKAEKNLSIGFQYIEPSTYPASLIPWVNDSEFDGRGLFSLPPSIHINEEPESPSPLPLTSSYNGHEYGMPILEAEENKALDNIQWAVSCRKSYFSPVKDPFNDTGFLNQDHWFISKIFNQGNRHPQIESLLPSELVLGLDWQRFPISSFPRDLHSASYHPLGYPSNQKLIQQPYEPDEYENKRDNSSHKGTLARFSGDAEDNVSVLDWSSSCFQVSLDRENAFPLILDS